MLLALVAKTCNAVLTTRHIQQRMRKRIGYKRTIYSLWYCCSRTIMARSVQQVLRICLHVKGFFFGSATVCNILLFVT